VDRPLRLPGSQSTPNRSGDTPNWPGSALGTINYLYDWLNLIEEVDSVGNVLTRYAQTEKTDEPLTALRSGGSSYYEADGLGSVTSLSNTVGTLANTYTYDSYGKLIASRSTSIGCAIRTKPSAVHQRRLSSFQGGHKFLPLCREQPGTIY
jgi:hypothetical protein